MKKKLSRSNPCPADKRFYFFVIASCLSVIAVLVCCPSSFGQVANNGIEQRIHIIPEAPPIQSTTAESTVEWGCINKKLTNKCIVYHNDQWFTFSVPDPGKYFLNITNQLCQDTYGIQMIIIEGNPCDSENYIIKRCISRLRMDDMYVELGMLKANQMYLLNVDGFLGDNCSFEIQLSKKPEGMPEILNPVFDSVQVVSPSTNAIRLGWRAPDSLLAVTRKFVVYRKEVKEKRFTFLAEQTIQSNAAGVFMNDYQYTDALNAHGIYDYVVLAVSDTASSIILQHQISWLENKKPVRINHTITIPLTFSKPGAIDVLVMDPLNDWVLKHYGDEFTFQDPTIQLSLFSFYTKGLRVLKVKVKNSKTREVNIFRYELGEGGWGLRQAEEN